MILILSVSLLVVFLLVVAALTFFSDRKAKVNRSLALFSATLALWIVFNFTAANFKQLTIAELMLTLDLVVGALLVLAMYRFAEDFFFSIHDRQPPLHKTSLVVVGLSSIVAAGLATGNMATIDGDSVVYAASYDVYGALVGTIAIVAVARVIHAYLVSDHKAKLKTRAVMWGLAIAMLANVVANFVIPQLSDASTVNLLATNLSYLGVAMFVLMSSVAIVKHQLFNVRLVVARSLAYVLTIGMLTLIYSVILFAASSIFWEGETASTAQQVVNVISAIVLAFTLQPLKRFFDRVTNRVFYRDAYSSEAVIGQINDVILSSLGLEGLLFGVTQTLSEELRAQFGVAGIKQVENVAQTIVSTNDIELDQADIDLVRSATRHLDQRVVLVDNIDSVELQSVLRKYHIDVLARIVADPGGAEEGLGYVALGPKRSGSPYGSKDIDLLNLVAGELVVAAQNALRFEEISRFNLQLSQKVDEATAELKDKNRKLRELDQAKDDFISMASHQLRTPLTTVKGYLSMLDDGDLGKLSAKQHDVVKLAYASSERMVYMISDLLNASRINTGKFVIDKEPLRLKAIIDSEIKQLSTTAEAHGVKVQAELSDQDPLLSLDENKTRQVIMNFIDNAIYYTKPDAEIKVVYEVTDDAVEFKVVDRGIGVPAQEQDSLFTKFYRAKNAKRVRPDGIGLGLFLAKQVITAQGGEVIFESKEGEGSTFGFRFALSDVAAADAKKSD